MLPASKKITESPINEKRKILPGAEEKIKEKGGSLVGDSQYSRRSFK